jgi:hypothetical protein
MKGIQALVRQVANRRDGVVGQKRSGYEPTYIALDGKGSGKFLFACVIAGLDCDDACRRG